MRGVFTVDEPSGQRWELALDLLRNGDAFALGRVTFRRIADDVIEAAVASSWLPENLTEAKAREDLEPVREQTEALHAGDAAFRAVVGTSQIDYVLVDDYDIGSIALCRLTGPEIEWLIDRT